ncbi:MAG: hypothetical protein HFI35_08490 [Roseburia sp.]|jgi:hypothetical protein|nr:hypothetical protein [Roseburia sp.]
MTIGIAGCDSGVGVTHLALALGSYCCSKQRKKVAYIELHARNEISRLLREETLDSMLRQQAAKASSFSQDTFCFRLDGVDYYPHASGNTVPILLNRGYDCLILDTGRPEESVLTEFLRCDRKLVIGSLAVWKAWKYEAFLHKLRTFADLGEGFSYLVQAGNEKSISDFSKSHPLSMRQVPFIKNPFRIEKDRFLFLEELLAAPVRQLRA